MSLLLRWLEHAMQQHNCCLKLTLTQPSTKLSFVCPHWTVQWRRNTVTGLFSKSYFLAVQLWVSQPMKFETLLQSGWSLGPVGTRKFLNPSWWFLSLQQTADTQRSTAMCRYILRYTVMCAFVITVNVWAKIHLQHLFKINSAACQGRQGVAGCSGRKRGDPSGVWGC